MNYSKQREAIVMALHTLYHPTAEEIHAEVAKTLPKVSLGTVYRNLTQLVDRGIVLQLVEGEKGKAHFDGNAYPHAHFVCSACGRIVDVALAEQAPQGLQGFVVEQTVCTYKGLCPECAGK